MLVDIGSNLHNSTTLFAVLGVEVVVVVVVEAAVSVDLVVWFDNRTFFIIVIIIWNYYEIER